MFDHERKTSKLKLPLFVAVCFSLFKGGLSLKGRLRSKLQMGLFFFLTNWASYWHQSDLAKK